MTEEEWAEYRAAKAVVFGHLIKQPRPEDTADYQLARAMTEGDPVDKAIENTVWIYRVVNQDGVPVDNRTGWNRGKGRPFTDLSAAKRACTTHNNRNAHFPGVSFRVQRGLVRFTDLDG